MITLLKRIATPVAVVALAALVMYQMHQGQFEEALESTLLGLIAAGLRSGMAKVNS